MTRVVKILTVVGAAALASGCGTTTLSQQKALTEKVVPVISQLRQRQADAAESRWALYAAAPIINAKVSPGELDGLAKALCAAPPRIPGEALDALDAFQRQLTALSKEPDASFSGYQQSIAATRKTLNGLASVGDYKAREAQRKLDADKEQADIVARGLDCQTVVTQNFAVDLSAPDFGTDVKALGSVAVIQAVAALILKVEQIADRELRAAALRQYVSIYKSEVAVALDQLDSSASQTSFNAGPVLRKTKEPANARSAYASMLRAHLQYLERKSLLLLRDAGNPALPRTVNLQAAEAFAETATAHAKVLGALTIADKTLGSLRTWYWTYTRAIESGPASTEALLDALFGATKDLTSLDDLYGALDKARAK